MYALRLIKHSGIISNISKSCIKVNSCSPLWCRAVITSSCNMALKAENVEDYWAKNQRLKRPISPHLTIYKPQVTSMLSLTHRGTGIVLSAVLTGFSIGMLALPESYPYYIGVIESMHFGSFLIFLAKFGITFPFVFHSFNGVRHLVWDMGYGFSLRTLYRSGYVVLGITLALSAMISAM